MALPLLALGGIVLSWHQAWSQSAPPSLIGEEMRRARNDFTHDGIRGLSANWYACVDEARGSQDANTAERCVVYGYSALLLGDASGAAARTPWMRHLTEDIVASGQTEMLTIMGIPEGPQQAWLDRYRRWVSNQYTPDTGVAENDAPRGGSQRDDTTAYVGAPYGVAPSSPATPGGERGQSDLSQAAAGKYPGEALRDPGVADALQTLVGPALFAHLKDYSFSSPMEFAGRYTVGLACEPHACGVSEARYVFSPGGVWVGIVDGRRLRIYGNPPRDVRALLLRDRNQAVWRGAVVDMTPPVPPQVIQASLGPTPGGPPRMSISPRPFLTPEPAPVGPPDSDTTEIRLRNHNGTFEVPVTINGAVTMPFAIDSGASDVSVSADVMAKLIQAGTVSRSDFRGKQVYHLADGSAVSSETFRIHTLKVGDREVRDVMASVTNDADSLLLGQSFLTRFRSWSIDNQRQVLLLR
jgi:clan AA aspartic protease (TIGR02281 family)